MRKFALRHASRGRAGRWRGLLPADPGLAAVLRLTAAALVLTVIRLTSGLSCRAFEQSIRDIPAVRSAVRVIGDVDVTGGQRHDRARPDLPDRP